MNNPLVSVIVTTRNNHVTLDACLKSIVAQTYSPTELIVVDNNSHDDTKAIAKKYTSHVFNIGPERCAQRNYAAQKASGEYLLIIDSDMELSPTVVTECVQTVQSTEDMQAVIIPEESFGRGFWANCKRLERSFYVGIDWMEAARFFKKQLFISLDGYNEQLVSGEDWDLSQRAANKTHIGRTNAYIYHNEGKLRLYETLRKKYYYAQKISLYKQVNKNTPSTHEQMGLFSRYKLFFSHPIKLFRDPVHGIGMLFMKTCEFGSGVIGYINRTERGAIEAK